MQLKLQALGRQFNERTGGGRDSMVSGLGGGVRDSRAVWAL